MTPDDVAIALGRLGFIADGATREEIVRIPTMRSPAYGGLGGERRTLGGRARYTLPGTDIRCTVGPRTVNLYTVRQRETTFIANWRTRDMTAADLETALRGAGVSPYDALITAETVTDAQIRSEHARAAREESWALAERCDAALRRSEDAWLREDVAAAINARQEDKP